MTIARSLTATAVVLLLLLVWIGGPDQLETRFEELLGYPEDAVPDDTEVATVALSLDGQATEIAQACNAADGALRVTTVDEATVTLATGEETLLGYQTEFGADQYDVEADQVGDSTVYRTIAGPDDTTAVDVVLELGDTTVLDDC